MGEGANRSEPSVRTHDSCRVSLNRSSRESAAHGRRCESEGADRSDLALSREPQPIAAGVSCPWAKVRIGASRAFGLTTLPQAELVERTGRSDSQVVVWVRLKLTEGTGGAFEA